MNNRSSTLIAIGATLVVLLLIPVSHHYELRSALEAYRAQLKADGEPMELRQVLPPAVSADQNGAPLLMQAGALLEKPNWDVLDTNGPPAMKMVARGKAMIGWAQPEIVTEDGKKYDTNSWEDEEAALSLDGPALIILRQISQHPSLDFNLDYQDGWDNLKLVQLVPLKHAVMALSADAVDALHYGDTASATHDLSIMLDLANGAAHDRMIISELVGMALTQISVSVTWEILQATNITDEQLAGMQRDWTRMEFTHGYENALAMERVISDISVTEWHRAGFRNFLAQWDLSADTPFEKFKMEMDALLWRYFWSYSDELRELKGSEILLKTMRDVETNGAFFANGQRQRKLLRANAPPADKLGDWLDTAGMRTMLSSSWFGSGSYFAKVMEAESARQMVITAIALKRYQLKYGHYPADLKSLVPEFVNTISLDPVDGLPVRYRPETNGDFLLYSLGANGVDDGGNPALAPGATWKNFLWQNRDALDWVWPQPASTQEIQNYYKSIGSEKD